MIILRYHEIFSGWHHQQPCRDTLVLSAWKNLMILMIIILSFCNIVKGQAKWLMLFCYLFHYYSLSFGGKPESALFWWKMSQVFYRYLSTTYDIYLTPYYVCMYFFSVTDWDIFQLFGMLRFSFWLWHICTKYICIMHRMYIYV